MKVCLFFEASNMLKTSGIGRALEHQKEALDLAKINYTTDILDDYDILHINTLLFKSYKVLKKAIKEDKKIIVHGHSTIEDYRNSFRFWKFTSFFYNRMLLKMYRNAKYIITPTDYSKKLIENYSMVNAKVYAVSNGIKLEEYQYNQKYVDEFKEFFNITNEKVVISVGLLFERKGLLDFFEVARSLPDYKFIWFGNLPKVFCQTKILKAIKDKPSNVIMPGYIKGNIIKGAYLASDVFFFPTKEETEGIVILEALASKTCVVTRNIGVYDSWMNNGDNCLKCNDNKQFIDAIEKVINDKELKDKLITNGYETAKIRSLDNVSYELRTIYEEVLENDI